MFNNLIQILSYATSQRKKKEKKKKRTKNTPLTF